MAEPSKTLITTAAVLLSENVIDWAFSRYRRRKNEKTKKDMECKMDVAFQELKKKMEALHESFTELQDTKQSELEGLRTHLEKNKGNKVEEIVWSVKSRLKKYLRQFSHGIRTLEENIEDWSETTESELQRLRPELQKTQEEVEIVWSLKSRLKKYLRQLSHGIQSLKENVEDLSETIEYELQCLRPELEKNKGKKEDESSNFCMETKVPQLSYRIQTLDPELQERWEFPNHELQFVTAGLENSQELFQPFQIKDLGEAPGASTGDPPHQDQPCTSPFLPTSAETERWSTVTTLEETFFKFVIPPCF
ncbi:uncharacterized protein LOC120747617 isoform X1 [Hirundo rustica]|uniref:uncharacterized protein LOC120747617 isoform X1 n=1 Tax=Hirundo rustica TaxID=43150 RepID=UPI0026728B56|nr:uncharacterized protein LOC120747617 isoform X1 [Hirundo rustica]